MSLTISTWRPALRIPCQHRTVTGALHRRTPSHACPVACRLRDDREQRLQRARFRQGRGRPQMDGARCDPGVRGEDDHRRMRWWEAVVAVQEGETVQRRHPGVEENHTRKHLLDGSERGAAIGRRDGGTALVGQGERHKLPDPSVGVDHEDRIKRHPPAVQTEGDKPPRWERAWERPRPAGWTILTSPTVASS